MSKANDEARPRRRDAERTRMAILAAATREFGAHGFSGARTERIAAAAGCNIRLLYHHFGNKEALYLAALEAGYADLRAKEAALVVDLADPAGAVEQLLRFTAGYFAANPDFDGLLRAENMIEGRFVRTSSAVPAAAGRLLGTLRAIIAAGEGDGSFRQGIDPVNLYVTITALTRFHLANGWSLGATLGEDLGADGWRARWVEHSVGVVRAWLRREGEGG